MGIRDVKAQGTAMVIKSWGAPVRMRGHLRLLASFLTQHSPATRSWRPLIICIGTFAPLMARISFLDSLLHQLRGSAAAL
jgi:hypothetical protein